MQPSKQLVGSRLLFHCHAWWFESQLIGFHWVCKTPLKARAQLYRRSGLSLSVRRSGCCPALLVLPHWPKSSVRSRTGVWVKSWSPYHGQEPTYRIVRRTCCKRAHDLAFSAAPAYFSVIGIFSCHRPRTFTLSGGLLVAEFAVRFACLCALFAQKKGHVLGIATDGISHLSPICQRCQFTSTSRCLTFWPPSIVSPLYSVEDQAWAGVHPTMTRL